MTEMQAEVPTGRRHWSQLPPPEDYAIESLGRDLNVEAPDEVRHAMKTTALDVSQGGVEGVRAPTPCNDATSLKGASPSTPRTQGRRGVRQDSPVPVSSPMVEKRGVVVNGEVTARVHGAIFHEELPPPLPESPVPTDIEVVSECVAPKELTVLDVETAPGDFPRKHVGVDVVSGYDEESPSSQVPQLETSTRDRRRTLVNGAAKTANDAEAGYANPAFESEEGSNDVVIGAPPAALHSEAAAPAGAATAKDALAAATPPLPPSEDKASPASAEETRRPRRVSFSERPPQRTVYDTGGHAATPAVLLDPAARAIKEQGLGPSERWRILRNVALVSAAFMLLFTAFFGAANLQSSVNADQGLGTASLTAVYAAIIVSNLFLPSVVIRWLGCKWAVAACMALFAPYAAAQLAASWASLVPTALLLGVAGAPMWCAKCSYLNAAAGAYAAVTGAPRDLVMVRFFGLFYVLFPLGHVWGNLITSEVLSTGGVAAANATLGVDVAAVCGANFCPSARSLGDNPNLARPPEHQIQIIATLFIGLTAAAALLVAVGVDDLRRYGEGLDEARGEVPPAPGASLLVATLRLLGDPNQLLLVPITAFIGISQAFLGADFTESYIACAWGIPYIGYVLVGYGLASSLASVCVSWAVKRAGRLPVVAASIGLFLALVGVLRWWTPQPGQGIVYVLLAAAWGLADSTALVINAMYGLLFRGREPAAYSNFSLWGSAGFIATYSYSPHLCASSKLAILVAMLLLALGGFVLAERALRRVLAAEEEAKRRERALASHGVGVLRDKAHAA